MRHQRVGVRRAVEPTEPESSAIMGWRHLDVPIRTQMLGGQPCEVIAHGNYDTVLVRLPSGRTTARSRRAVGM